jgi:acyl-CoA thioester hydrolase
MSDVTPPGRIVYEGRVLPEWIDVNKHMNVAYYVLAFDYGIDGTWEQLGITEEYLRNERASTFAVECHLTYQKELLEDDPYLIKAQLLAYDDKRIHQFQRMYHAEKGFLCATAEWLQLHVSLETRRVSPWPASILTRLRKLADSQEGQSRPTETGKVIRLKSPHYTL